MKKLIKHCEECFGEGEISSCCGDFIEDRNCLGCGKFASCEVCGMCSGWGKIEFEVGTEVSIFVCVVSPQYLKDLLYNSKKLGNFKTYYGVVKEIIDDITVKVKVEGKRNLIEIKIEDLEVN